MGDRHGDRGFSLVETVVVISLIGVVSAVIGLAVTTSLRTAAPSIDRVDDTRSVQGLVAWLPRDAASTPADGANIAKQPPSLQCAGSEAAAGDNLLELRWTESSPAATTYVVAYRLEDVSGGKAVRRHACTSVGGFADTTSIKVTAELADTFTVTASPPYSVVAFDLQTTTGEAIRIEGTPRNPDDTLPATTPAPTVVPSSTTTTTTTTTSTTTTIPATTTTVGP